MLIVTSAGDGLWVIFFCPICIFQFSMISKEELDINIEIHFREDFHQNLLKENCIFKFQLSSKFTFMEYNLH